MLPKFIICGVEHSGTTLLSDIFRQVQDVDSGFEVGVMLAESPRDFRDLQPFASNIIKGWGLQPEDIDHICDVDSFEDFYTRLAQRSSVVADDAVIFDKTPRYFAELGRCRKNFAGPIVATYKDPRSIVYSDYKRAGVTEFNAWYKTYMPKKRAYLGHIYKNYLAVKEGQFTDVLAVSLEDICLNTRETLGKVFDLFQIPFRVEYLLLKNLRYAHTRAPYVASNIPFEYLGKFRGPQIERIKQDFRVLRDWFYATSDEDVVPE